MWSDHAATVDLLGYEDLLVEIVELALDETLQPLTIGAFGILSSWTTSTGSSAVPISVSRSRIPTY